MTRNQLTFNTSTSLTETSTAMSTTLLDMRRLSSVAWKDLNVVQRVSGIATSGYQVMVTTVKPGEPISKVNVIIAYLYYYLCYLVFTRKRTRYVSGLTWDTRYMPYTVL